jgi:hypothetical protein
VPLLPRPVAEYKLVPPPRLLLVALTGLSLSDSPAIISLLKTLSPNSGVSLPIPQNKNTYATPKPHENSLEKIHFRSFPKKHRKPQLPKTSVQKKSGFPEPIGQKPSL